jgi:Ulp1 family protease
VEPAVSHLSRFIKLLLCRTLTSHQRSKYKEITAGPQDYTPVALHEQWGIEVARHHFSTCALGEWLADPIINMYMALLQVSSFFTRFFLNF